VSYEFKEKENNKAGASVMSGQVKGKYTRAGQQYLGQI
jgi:hypothetical protein